MTASRPTERVPSCAWVLWSGTTGGTELLSASLAREARRQGHDARVLFIGDEKPLAATLDGWGVPWASLGISDSKTAFRSGAAFKELLRGWGCSAVVLPTVDALGRVLRSAGFGGEIIAVDHGAIADQRRLGAMGVWRRRLSRRLGVSALSAQVAVSEYVRRELMEYPHAARVEVIPNGVDTERFMPASGVPVPSRDPSPLRMGVAARLEEGKGIREAVAVAGVLHGEGVPVLLEIAGEGPLGGWLESHPLVSAGVVVARGRVDDMVAFWQRQDCALALSHGLTETFGMAAVEAMACGLPVVASGAGGLAEVVSDGWTGVLIAPGDVSAAAAAVRAYAADDERRRSHGETARALAVERFSIVRCAKAYLGLCGGAV